MLCVEPRLNTRDVPTFFCQNVGHNKKSVCVVCFHRIEARTVFFLCSIKSSSLPTLVLRLAVIFSLFLFFSFCFFIYVTFVLRRLCIDTRLMRSPDTLSHYTHILYIQETNYHHYGMEENCLFFSVRWSYTFIIIIIYYFIYLLMKCVFFLSAHSVGSLNDVLADVNSTSPSVWRPSAIRSARLSDKIINMSDTVRFI